MNVRADESHVATLQEVVKTKNPAMIRRAILTLEKVMEAYDEVECPVTDVFIDGLYCRQCFNPAGTLIVGKIQRHGCLAMIVCGEVKVFDEHGERHLVAGEIFESKPGAKRVVLALKDTVFATIHANPTNETDPVKLEAHLVAPSYESLGLDVAKIPMHKEQPWLG